MIYALRTLAFVQVFFAAFAAMVGSFADGGQWWERLILVGVHPAAAVLLLILVMNRESSRILVLITTALLALNVVADVGLAAAIGSGAIKGDWGLPLVFAVVPLIALPYCIVRYRNS
ncbi:MAG: hypothetical protein OXN80_04255 [bacterium]|nr:hypothetical protein [bacterium]MDE0188294.1 hypothetical protein [bacterium]MDE0502392.1 hypothetical protein [bacterium]